MVRTRELAACPVMSVESPIPSSFCSATPTAARMVADRTSALYHSSSRAMSSMTVVQRGHPRTAVTSPLRSRTCSTRPAATRRTLDAVPPYDEYPQFSRERSPPAPNR